MAISVMTVGAQQEFEQLYQRSQRRAYNLAYRLTGNATDAEDVTQELRHRCLALRSRHGENRHAPRRISVKGPEQAAQCEAAVGNKDASRRAG